MALGKNNPLLYLFSKTWHYSEDNRKSVVGYWIMFILANAFQYIFNPLVWAQIMNTVQEQGITPANIKFLFGLLILTLVIEVVFWSLHGPARLMEGSNAFKVRANYRKFLLKGVMTLPMEWQADHHSGDTIDKIEKGTNSIYSFSEESFEVIASVVQLIVSFGMLVYFSPPAAYTVIAMILITGYIIILFDRVMIGQYKELNSAENHISESVFDAISNITTVIILRVEKLVFDTIGKKIDKPFELYKRNLRLNEMKWFLTNVCCATMTIIVLGVYFWQNNGSNKVVLVGSVFILSRYLENIGNLFFRFAGMYSDIVKRKTRVMNSEELSDDFKVENFTNHILPARWRQLNVKGLNFSYNNEKDGNLNLEDVSLSIKKGERIALVGESGSGKTTFMKLMRDLYHPNSLSLSVDGRVIPDGFGGIARAIALVPQDPEIFATTILENITIGAEYELDFICQFTDMACFTDVVENLPKKFDSSIKEKGVNLSGGEQQRLALARGLLACNDKSIVLLDEPTSSLDTATEMTVYQNIFRKFSGKTIISSIHKLHLLPLFDQIYLFGNGRIIASGSLAELLKECPEFKELWQRYHEYNPGAD